MMRKPVLLSLVLLICFSLLAFIPGALAEVDEPESRLLKVRQAIQKTNARWKASGNPISKLRIEEQRKLLGWIPSPQSDLYSTQMEVLDGTAYGAALPTQFDWRDVSGKNYISSVKRQRCGDCWAFAAIGAMEARMAIDGQPGEDLSEQLLVSNCCSTGSCGGGYIVATSRFIRDTGSPDEGCYPYLGRDSDCGQACGDWRTTARKMNSYTRVSQTVSALKNALYTRGPINVGMMVYSDFSSYNSGIYEYSYGSREGGHAVLIVGYDDDSQCFIVKNSWGTTWGENGYFRIAYSQVDGAVDFGAEACVYGDEIDHGDTPDPDPDPDNELSNGEVVNDLAGSKAQWLYYTIKVPAGASDLRVEINGGSGDADLYVNAGSDPGLNDYDCRPYRWGNNEACTFAAPTAGVYHIGLYGYSAFSGVDLNASFVEEAPNTGDAVELLGQWTSGSSHSVPSGGQRALILTVHAEDDDTDLAVVSATYGGQPMEKVIERVANTGYRAYVAAFILDEAGIAASGGADFEIEWNHTPSRTPGLSSAFYGNVDQSQMVAAKASAAGTGATVSTQGLATGQGDLVVTAATCGNAGGYTVNNGFAKTIELSVTSADGVVGGKTATGAGETPSVTHSAPNRQAVIGFVVQAP